MAADHHLIIRILVKYALYQPLDPEEERILKDWGGMKHRSISDLRIEFMERRISMSDNKI